MVTQTQMWLLSSPVAHLDGEVDLVQYISSSCGTLNMAMEFGECCL